MFAFILGLGTVSSLVTLMSIGGMRIPVIHSIDCASTVGHHCVNCAEVRYQIKCDAAISRLHQV